MIKQTIKLLLILTLVVGTIFLCAVSASAEIITETVSTTTFSLDTDTDTLTISGTGTLSASTYKSGGDKASYRAACAATAAIDTLSSTNMADIVTIKIEGLTKFSYTNYGSIFYGLTNLETVIFPNDFEIGTNSAGEYPRLGLFQGCSALKTIYCGTGTDGIIDLSGLKLSTGASTTQPTSYHIYMFHGCSSIEHVIFPNDASYTGIKGGSWTAPFNESCTSLTAITIPENIASLTSNTLKNLTNLKNITVMNPDFDLSAVTSIPQNSGMTFNVASQAQYDYVTENFEGAVVSKYLTSKGTEEGLYYWELFDGSLTFKRPEGNTGALIETSKNCTAFNTWKTTYGSKVEHIVIDDVFTGIAGYNAITILSGYDNLISVNLGNVNSLTLNYMWGEGIFKNNPSLTTVYGNSSSEPYDDVVDISFMTNIGGTYDNASHSGLAKMFYGCKSIAKVILPTEEPTHNSKYSFIPVDFFSGCTSLSEVVLPSYVTTVSEGAFKDCGALTKLQIENPELDIASVKANIPDNEGLTIYVSSETQYNAIDTGFENAAPSYILYEGEQTGSYHYTWSLDSHTGVLTFALGEEHTMNGQIRVTKGVDAFTPWREKYADLVKKIVMGDGITRIYSQNRQTVICGYENLTEIDLNDVTAIGGNVYSWTGAMSDNKALTTVYGGDVERKENVVDISFITRFDGAPDGTDNMTQLFEGCSSVRKVILPSEAPVINSTTGDKLSYIGNAYFKGCSSLEEIIIPSYVTEIRDNAFAGCTSLTKVILGNPNATVKNANAFPANSSLIILCANKSQEAVIKAVCSGVSTDNYNALVNEGRSIRLNGKNGLRGVFGFDTDKQSLLSKTYGLTLSEFGLITASAAKYDYWKGELTLKNGEYVTCHSSILKKPVGKLNAEGEIEFIGKVLSTNPDNKDNTIDFAIALVNYKNNFMTDVYMGSYAVFKDENGNHYYAYTDINDEKYHNIYGTTVEMLTDDVKKPLVNQTMTVESVWNTLYQGAIDLDGNGTRVMDIGSNAKMLVAEYNGKNYLMAAAPTISEAESAITLAEAAANDLGISIEKAVSLAVSDILTTEPTLFDNTAADPIFLEDEWTAHVDAQLAKIPENGKSFVFITDTHWRYDNNGQSPELLKYVKAKTGIDTVIFGGDLITNETLQDENDPNGDALRDYEDFWQNGMVSRLGTGAIFVMGNHDGNYLRNKESASADTLIADTDIYNMTVKELEALNDPTGDRYVEFDNDGIARMRQVLSAAGHSEADILEAEAMMKMHFTYDDNVNKTRYIVLDTGGNAYSQIITLNSSYVMTTATQYAWLAKVLGETPDDYDIVVAAHELSETTEYHSKARPATYIYKILSAFKSKSTYTIADPCVSADWGTIYESDSPELYAFVNGQNCSYDFTESKHSGKLITLSGHIHKDRAWIVNNDASASTAVEYSDEAASSLNSRAILAISTGADAYKKGDVNVIKDSIPENQLFDIITITDDGIICTRIGAGESRTFKY